MADFYWSTHGKGITTVIGDPDLYKRGYRNFIQEKNMTTRLLHDHNHSSIQGQQT